MITEMIKIPKLEGYLRKDLTSRKKQDAILTGLTGIKSYQV